MASIDLVCGALGAGKTTYIKKYTGFLANKGLSFAVIENEYGEAGVDSAFLARAGIETSELSGGCICCTLKVGFHDELVRLAGCADHVIVEPSGIYDITTFFAVTDSPELKEIADRGAVICIVDPHSFDRLTTEERRLLTAQISAASCVIISKSENLDSKQLNSVKAKICMFSGKKNLPFAEYSDFDVVSKSRSEGCIAEPDSDHSSLFQSARLSPKCTYTKDSIENACNMVFNSFESGRVIRIKGFVNGKHSYLGVNATKEHCEVFEVNDASPVLNIIGSGLSRKVIKEILMGEKVNES